MISYKQNTHGNEIKCELESIVFVFSCEQSKSRAKIVYYFTLFMGHLYLRLCIVLSK